MLKRILMTDQKRNNGNSRKRSLRVLYNCSKCPAYCCSYDRIHVTKRDVLRLAKHFKISYTQAERRYTKMAPDGRVLRQQKDHIFKQVCQFLDPEERRCTIYNARPHVCRTYPDSLRCGYYDFLSFERQRQDDKEFIPSA